MPLINLNTRQESFINVIPAKPDDSLITNPNIQINHGTVKELITDPQIIVQPTQPVNQGNPSTISLPNEVIFTSPTTVSLSKPPSEINHGTSGGSAGDLTYMLFSAATQFSPEAVHGSSPTIPRAKDLPGEADANSMGLIETDTATINDSPSMAAGSELPAKYARMTYMQLNEIADGYGLDDFRLALPSQTEARAQAVKANIRQNNYFARIKYPRYADPSKDRSDYTKSIGLDDPMNTTVDGKDTKDFVQMYFTDMRNKKTVRFRTFLSTLSDSVNMTSSEIEYIGRPDIIKLFDKRIRSLSLGFTLVAGTRAELLGIYAKLNVLQQMTAPTMDHTHMVSPYILVNIGDLVSKEPGIINSLQTPVRTELYPWEINIEGTLNELPKMIDVSLDITLFGKEIPTSSTKFYNIKSL